ncbi:MAG: hypothetical protein N4A49_08265 [Marinifilaceae bacterium]|jgi:hypothetical protein|nr:hypothetical protein [Marinifilaceae bacterium]
MKYQENKLLYLLVVMLLLFNTLFLKSCSNKHDVVFKNDAFTLTNSELIENNEIKNFDHKEKSFERHNLHLLSDCEFLKNTFNASVSDIEFYLEDLDFESSSKLYYVIIHSLALLKPELSKKILLNNIKNNQIKKIPNYRYQWPININSNLWARAAWEVYLSSGDEKFLRKAFYYIKKQIDIELNTNWDFTKFIFRSYAVFDEESKVQPRWLKQSDMFNSYSLLSQLIMYSSIESLILMGDIIDKDVNKYKDIIKVHRNSIYTSFYDKELKSLVSAIYGRKCNLKSNMINSFDNSLAIILDAIDSDIFSNIIENIAYSNYGAIKSFPIPETESGNMLNVDPITEAYVAWASAKASYSNNMMYNLACLTRLSNYDVESVVVGSSVLDGNVMLSKKMNDKFIFGSTYIGVILRSLFRFDLNQRGLAISPVIPREFKSGLRLNNFKYRDAILNINVLGFGDRIVSFKLDTAYLKYSEIPLNLKGAHNIEIRMSNSLSKVSKPNIKKEIFAAESSPIKLDKQNNIYIETNENISKLFIFKDGNLYSENKKNFRHSPRYKYFAEYTNYSVGRNRLKSEFSEPVNFIDSKFHILRNFNYGNKGYVLNTKDTVNYNLFKIKLLNPGQFILSFNYSNANSLYRNGFVMPNMSVWINDQYSGVIVFPDTNKWSNYEYSSWIKVKLKKGMNEIKLSNEAFNLSSNHTAQLVRLRKMSLQKISD